MIHFLPDPESFTPAPVDARLAGLDRALAVVEQLGGELSGPHHDLSDVWNRAGDAQRLLVGDWSERAASASAAGLEAVAALHAMGLQANPAALRRLADDIRAQFETMGAVLSL